MSHYVSTRKGKLEVEGAVNIASDSVVRLDDLLNLDLDEMIEGIDVLFDQALDLQKCWQEVPFILSYVRRAF